MGEQSQHQRVLIERSGSTAHVVLNRADKHNGMDVPMLKAVVAAQKQLRNARGLRAVILRGDGPSFCSGLDVKQVLGKPLSAAGLLVPQLWSPWRNIFQRWSMGWRELGVPVIAVVHGNCFGAGLQLALGADFRICAPQARLSLMEAKWGLVPDMGGAALLRELMPIDIAKSLTLTGRVVEPDEALKLHLVTEVATDPLARALELAAEIETRSPDAVAAGKFLLQNAWDASVDGALGAERRWQRRLIGRKNQRIAAARGFGSKDAAAYAERSISD